jgi:hypothetical protein
MKLGVSYFGNRMPEHFAERDLPELVAMGCTFVLHTFSEHDLEFYPEAIKEMVRLSKDAGLEVYVDPWGVGGVFGGEAYSRFLLNHPEAWQMTADGVPVPMACPNSPALHALMARWTEAAAALGADVLFWDEPHFTSEHAASRHSGYERAGCHCAVCQKLFRDRHGWPMEAADPLDLTGFREDSIVGFIARLCRDGAARGMRNAVCLLPFEDEPRGLPHWERIATIPDLHVLGVTPFWHLRGQEVRPYLGGWARRLKDLCDSHGKEPQVWLQAFLIREGREAEVETAAAVAYDAGIRNMAAWGFRACAHMAPLRPDRPEFVWAAVQRAFASLRARP